MELTKVFIEHPDILNDRNKLKSVFSDYYVNNKAQVNRLMKAYEEGIFDLLIANEVSEFDKRNIINKLVDNHDMVQAKAKEATDTWFKMVTKNVIDAYLEYVETHSNKGETTEPPTIEEEETNITPEPIESIIKDYVNPLLRKEKDVIQIPCGVGNSDYGFKIIGLREAKSCTNTYSGIFALVYNYLIRNTNIQKKDYPLFFERQNNVFSLDYKNIFRYEIILLQLMKNNYLVGNTLSIRLKGNKNEVKMAAKIINNYLALFCRLASIKPFILKVAFVEKKAPTVSLDYMTDIYVVNYKKPVSLAREIWFESKIKYHLTNNNRKDLEYLLREMSPFESFKEGQYEALCSMLNAKEHAVCIMPTGSGKSLVYYFASLLQPVAIFVVSPTDILIKDQIRNLERFHHYDNVSHLKLTTDNDFVKYEIRNNLVYLTPTTFQNRNLLVRFRRFNEELLVAYVVLDEIHCLSNWGHDFRPEYLMLSKNLRQFFDRTTFLGFTATANYSVVEDIQKQLDIPFENICSPVLFEKYNTKYDFRPVQNENGMFKEVKKIADDILRRNERALVFTKSDDISTMVAEKIGYEADVFTNSKPEAYQQFADGYCNILVTNEDLGIGINFPDVNATIHFGIPVSKNEYVQEIGRAGRANETVTSYVIYLEPSENNINPDLLKRETLVDNLPQILEGMNNDYTDAYHKLNLNADTSGVLMDRLKDIYSDFRITGRGLYVATYAVGIVENVKQYLYMLYIMGYIRDWYSWRANTEEGTIDIMIDINATNYDYYKIESHMVERMQKKAIEYFTFMGNDRKTISLIQKADSIARVLQIYVEWYYENYLYHHKEEFLDFFEFVRSNQDCDSDSITDDIQEYFILPFVDIKTDEKYYTNMSFNEISDKVKTGIGKSTLSNIERINSNQYSYKLDFLLLMGNWKKNGHFDSNRLERLWRNLNDEEKSILSKTIFSLYPNCNDEGKWNLLKYFDSDINIMDLRLRDAFDKIYLIAPRDKIYYGVLAKVANERFRGFIRS